MGKNRKGIIMTAEDYWQALLKKNPGLNKDRVTLKTIGLKKIIEQAYFKGVESQKLLNEHHNSSSDPTVNELRNMFDGLGGFGGFK